MERATKTDRGLSFVYAIPNHPWVDDTAGAQVRIAMTACAPGRAAGTLALVTEEHGSDDGSAPQVQLSLRVGAIQPDPRIGVSLQKAVDLLSN